MDLQDGIDISVWSHTQDPQRRKEQVATLSFSETPPDIRDNNGPWAFPIPAENQSLAESGRNMRTITLDIDFDGLTPLHNTRDEECIIDCIAVTGLNAHAFGSFKARGGSFMWLRDNLPHDFHQARIFTYGYDTQLVDSTSFQNISDLAAAFCHILHNMRSQPGASTRSIVLMAHSLGGILVKQALIQLSESTDASYSNILGSLKGVLFFGVPNQGMNIESLLPMVGSNPNLQLLQTLGEKLNPAFLHDQAQRFQMILDTKAFPIVSFYETRMSPTAVFVDGRWQMSGPPEVLVNPTSARHGCSFGSDVVPVNKSHSDMVKFNGPQDTVYYLVLHKLRNMREDGSWDQFHDQTRRVMERTGKTYASFLQLRQENPNPNVRMITGNLAMNIVFVPWQGFTLVVFFVIFWGGVFYGVKSLVNGKWTGPFGDPWSME